MPEPLSILSWDPEEGERSAAPPAAAQRSADLATPAPPTYASPRATYVEEQRRSPSPVKMVLGLAGALLLVGGVFAPFIGLPLVGSLSYINNGRGDGIIVLGLGVVALVLTVVRFYKALPFAGMLVLLTLAFTYYNFNSRMAEAQENFANLKAGGNPFTGLAEAMMQTVQLQWGWGVLIVGALLLILTPLVRE